MKKMRNRKRFVSFILVCAVGVLSFMNMQVYGQEKTKRISLKVANVSVLQALHEVNRLCGNWVMFRTEEVVKEKGRVTVDVKNKSVLEVVKECLKGTALGCVEKDGKIIVTVEGVKTLRITGLVTDGKAPLPGATVLVKGLTMGTVTDAKGRYVLSLPMMEKLTLLFSFMGMETREVVYAGKDTINVVLREVSEVMDEVVVTGYQRIRKMDMVGSTNTIKREDMVFDGTNSIEQMLQGKLPGVVVMNTGGMVGTRQKVRVRGTSTLLGNQEPVWVVDGIIQEDPLPFDAQALNDLGDNFDMISNFVGNSIAWLNPNDIEDITVLKDASATVLYGVKAANGVIVINTKRGKNGRLSVTYSGGMTVTEKLNYKKMNLMNSKERIDFSREIYEKRLLGQIPTTSVGYEREMKRYMDKEITYDEFNAAVKELEEMNTDWMDILYQTQLSHNHSVSVSGGSDKVTYYSSLNYVQNKGAAKGNETESLGASFRMDAHLSKKIRVGFGLNANYSITDGFYVINPYSYALSTSRAIPCFDKDGELFFYERADGLKFNILHELSETGNTNDRRTFNMTANFNYDILPGVRFESLASFGSNNTVGESYASEYSYYITAIRGYEFGQYLKGDPAYERSKLPHGGELNNTEARSTSFTWRNSLSYNQLFGKHRIGFVVGQESRSTLNKQVSAVTYGYFPNRGKNVTLPPHMISSGVNPIYQQIKTTIVDRTSNFLSFYGSMTYSYDERYVFTASVRSDASNRFGQDSKSKFLPVWSLGGRWNVHNESWMQNQKVFSELNMRFSYGWQGNVAENFGPDLIAKLPTNVVNNVTGEYELEIKSLPYADLRWEKTKTVNLGADMGLFKNRVMLSVEYYLKRAEDLIIYKSVPVSYGIKEMPINGGTMRNEGIELNLSTTLVRLKDFVWNISMNTSKNRNRIKSTILPDNSWLSAVSGELNKNGYPVSAFWAFELKGLNPVDGTPVFDIPNKNDNSEGIGVNDATDYMKYMGKMEPDFTGGLSMSFRYKNLSLSSGFTLSVGGKRFLHSLFQSKNFPYSLPSAYDNYSKEFVKRWRKTGDEAHTNIPSIPSVGTGNVNISFPAGNLNSNVYEMYDYSDARVVNASFLRCNNLTLTYNVPENVVKYTTLKAISVSGSVSNPFIIVSKDYKGVDPEVATGGQPLSRVYSIRLNVTF